jgi:hypothetical protein
MESRGRGGAKAAPPDRRREIETVGNQTEHSATDTDSYVLVPIAGSDEHMAVFSDGSYARWTPLERID